MGKQINWAGNVDLVKTTAAFHASLRILLKKALDLGTQVYVDMKMGTTPGFY